MNLQDQSKFFFNPEQEQLSRDEISLLQQSRLQETLVHVLKGSPFYRNRLGEIGLTLDEISNPRWKTADVYEILSQFPTMSKKEFREQYPLGMLAVPKSEVREMHMSSGSTGTPVVMPYTLDDLRQWSECMARCYRMAGALPADVVQITPSFGLFNGGFGMFHGARTADLFIVPTGSGNTERQIRLAKDFGTKVLTAVVSYCVRIIEMLDEMKMSLPELKIGIFGAESFSNSMKKLVESRLGIEVFDIYGMTETGGVGTLGQDCQDHSGIHVWEDQYILEILNPQTGAPVPDGELGELTVTSLTRKALPVIRFRTGDLTRILSRKRCDCGRTHLRIETISGRTDDMMIVKGVNFFPQQVEQALMEIPGVLPQYQIILEKTDGVQDVRINVEAQEGVTGYTVVKHLKERLGFSPKGDVFPPGTLPRSEGKAKHVFRQED